MFASFRQKLLPKEQFAAEIFRYFFVAKRQSQPKFKQNNFELLDFYAKV